MTNLITEARELCEKATPGPWTVSGSKGQIIDSALSLNECDVKSIVCDIWHDVEGNAAFIARSRTLIPELCDALEKAERESGCDYCLTTWPNHAEGISDMWHGNQLSVGYGIYREINYCPMCGARVEAEPAGEDGEK